MKVLLVSLLTVLFVSGCASPYAAQMNQLHEEYRLGRISEKEYASRRAYLQQADAHYQAGLNYRRQQYGARVQQNIYAQQQRPSYYRPAPAYRPPPSYKISPDPYGGYDVTPQSGALGFDPYASPY